MGELMKTVRSHLDANDLKYSVSDDDDEVLFVPTTPSGNFAVRLQELEDRHMLVCIVHLPGRVPQSRRTAVAELIARLNYQFIVGGFNMDLRDGELLFKTSGCFVEALISEETVGALIGLALTSAGRHLHMVYAVAFGEVSPADAMKQDPDINPSGLAELPEELRSLLEQLGRSDESDEETGQPPAGDGNPFDETEDDQDEQRGAA